VTAKNPALEQPMTETAALADHLDERTDAILAVWKARVDGKGNIPDARQLSYAEFIDHVPEILEQIAAYLRGDPPAATIAGRKHGSVRWRQGYDVAEVVRELSQLRKILVQATFAHAKDLGLDLDTIERAIAAIDFVLDEAVAASVLQLQEENQEHTELMLAEVESRRAAVDAERSKLRTVLNSLPVGVWVVDVSGMIVDANREAEKLQGLPASETVNFVNIHDHASHYDLTNAEGRPVDSSELPAIVALRGENVEPYEMIWRVEGKARSILTNAAPLRDAVGSISGAVMVAQDVSEREDLKTELANSELRFRTIVEQSPTMKWQSDATGRFDYFNPTWLDFRGRTLEQEAGNGWTLGIHPDDRERFLASYRDAFERRETFELTYRLLRRDGHYRWVLDRGTPFVDARGAFLGYLGSCADITARVELEEALERQSQHKSRVMAALSHDVRTPLNAVFLAAKLLETQVKDQDDPEVPESLRVIRDSVRNLLDLLTDLLDLSRIEAGASLAEVSRFALESTLAECFSSIEPQAHLKGLDVGFEPDGLAGIHVATDRNKLKQILANLLSNALRYTNKGHVRLFGERTSDQLRISVEDTGIGINPDDQTRIFDEFATLGTEPQNVGEGTGLGLAICRRLATLLQGEILLESTPGVGSTFTLVLPASLIVDGESEARAPEVLATPQSGPILIAEDHEPSRRALARVLQRIGYTVLEAADGREAIELARTGHPFIVLMDVNMPGMDGIEATRLLRGDRRTRDLPIFALTGDVTIVNRRRIGEAGVDGYLEKPVTWDQIESALAHVRDRLPKPLS
jgi:PAS domain S-box-containing protein